MSTMTSVDLSNLKLVQEDIDVADESLYKDATEFPSPIPEGVYTLVQGKPEFDTGSGKAAGYLQATMNHTVAGGEHDGQRVMFDRITNKPFEREGVKVSFMNDHLRALGDRTRYRKHDEFATAMAAGEGKSFKAVIKWDGWCGHKDTEFAKDGANPKDGVAIRGAKNFDQNGEAKCGVCGGTIRARARIDRRIAAS